MPIVDERQVREASLLNARLHESKTSPWRKARQELSLEELHQEIARLASLPLSQAQSLPREAYISDDFFAWEMDHLFRSGWICLAHSSQLSQNGDFINVEMFGEPLVVVRDKAAQIHVLSRSCPHRGMDVMPPGFGHDGHGPAEFRQGAKDKGHTRFFLCPYHSWTFELDGSLKACPEMQQAEGFSRCDWGLHSFRSEIWNGFVFVNLDGKCEFSVSEQYQGITHHVAPWKLGELEVIFESHWDIACNWKVLTENFMESYHHAGTHVKTLQRMMPAKGTWNQAEEPHFIQCHLDYGEETKREIAEAEAAGRIWDTFPPFAGLTDQQRHEWGLFLGYPIFTFLVTPDQVVWYRIEPVSVDSVRVLTTILVSPKTKEHPEYETMRQRAINDAVSFHLEDMEVLPAVQRSAYGSGYQQGRLSHLEMSVWLIQRYFAARKRGTYPTFDQAAAPSQR